MPFWEEIESGQTVLIETPRNSINQTREVHKLRDSPAGKSERISFGGFKSYGWNID
jgi:hypothetical protein